MIPRSGLYVAERAKSEQAIESGQFRFEVDAGLLFQLGERLVARRSIALSELIKNAYDADATRVKVRLENVTRSGGRIIVEDDGTGMTFEQVRDHWMRIATDDKIRNPVSPLFGRPRTGAKGIGRFAARRLSSRLILRSVAARDEGVREQVVVEFDWKKRFRQGQTLTEIPVTYSRAPVAVNTPTGVALELEDARDIWTKKDIAALQRDLSTLVSPFPGERTLPRKDAGICHPDPGFSIDFDAPEFPEYRGRLEQRFLSSAWGELTGRVDDHGVPGYHLHIRRQREDLDFTPGDQVFEGLAGASFRLHHFVYRAKYLEDSIFSVRDAQKMGRRHGGVRVYLDGFRVFPYGEPGDDWLRLDEMAARRPSLIDTTEQLVEMAEHLGGRPWLNIPGNNRVFGAVAISRLKQPSIVINISRERLVENEAFDDLRRFVQIGIYWITLQYARVRVEEAAKQKRVGPPAVVAAIERAQAKIRVVERLPEETRREVLGLLDYAGERARAEREEHINAVSLLRVLSSTGAAVAVIDHQLRAVTDGIRAIHTDLSELWPYVSEQARPRLAGIIARVKNWREAVENQVSQLGSLLGRDSRKRRRVLVLQKVVDDVSKPLSLYIRDFGIKFTNEVSANCRTPPMFEAELHAVLLHALTNALKAVREAELREVTVRAVRKEDGLHIFMLDTGRGVGPEMREKVFRPFVTDSTPDPILGVGTGLGLWVVRDILDTYGGTAQFVDAPKGWQTCLKILLPAM